jgi:exonuclease III
MANLQLYSFNVRGIRDSVKRKVIFHYLKKKCNNAIFCLQETHGSPAIETRWNQDWGSKIYYSHGTTDSCGVAILMSPGLDYNISNVLQDEKGRFLALHINEWENEDVLLCNIYAPTRNHTQDQLDFLSYMKNIIAKLDFVHLILGGDFNTIFDPLLDKQGGDMNNCTNRYTSELKAFMETYDLSDAIRLYYPDRKVFTRTQRKPAVLTRIDHWLISSQLCNYMQKTDVYPGIKSDHSVIYLILNRTNTKRGRGFWKFNAELLKDADYVSGLKTLLDELIPKTSYMVDKGLRWDYIKTELRGYSLKHSFKKSKEKREFKSNLESEFKSLEKELENELSDASLEKFYAVKDELEQIEQLETKGAIL